MILILLAWLVVMTAVLILAWSVVKPKPKANLHNYIRSIGHNNPGLNGLWHQLLMRVNFDVDKAEFLIGRLKQKYPLKSDRELIERAIWIIEAHKSKKIK